ncbi:hypothetical protein CUC15_04640 [Oceanobacillus zhaokaii]|uniref:Uncharacterized protein n=1 Tax=Oceanobacillus zhaokaii TaxID=2052660 RepID=A0A345PE34_9BACI|nr:hypothetical protein CUC15_04640 [Oceanobacillus zhaokaii]
MINKINLHAIFISIFPNFFIFILFYFKGRKGEIKFTVWKKGKMENFIFFEKTPSPVIPLNKTLQ